jgi:type VI secretion system protein ImpA
MEVNSIPPVMNLDALLAPISEENPSGASLRYEPVYAEIKEARRADLNLAQGDWAHELKVADWRKTIELSIKVLTTQTKDLQIAAWLAEAEIKENGFAGLRDSLKLMRGFHEQFWESVFPEIDEGNDLEARANAVEFMDRQAALAVKETALTANGLNYLDWEESKSFDIPENLDALEYAEQEKYRALQQQATEENRTTGEMWRKAKAASRRPFYETLWLTIEECQTEFALLDQTIDECFGNQTPGLGQLKKSLDNVRDLVKKLLDEKRQAEPTEEELNATTALTQPDSGDETNSAAAGGAFYAATAATSGAIRSRQDALKRLSEVAEFFKQTEPHSPVAYLVNRAVKWGNMPLETWLQDVIKDEAVLGQIRETLGLNNYQSSQSPDEN